MIIIYSMSIEKPKFHKSEIEREIIENVDLTNLERGDKVIVEIGTDQPNKYEIILMGRERNATKVRVSGAESFTARLLGTFEVDEMKDTPKGRIVVKKGRGLIKDVIESGENNALYFETLKDATGEKISTAMRTQPNLKIEELKTTSK